jgi:hypothetical protein
VHALEAADRIALPGRAERARGQVHGLVLGARVQGVGAAAAAHVVVGRVAVDVDPVRTAAPEHLVPAGARQDEVVEAAAHDAVVARPAVDEHRVLDRALRVLVVLGEVERVPLGGLRLVGPGREGHAVVAVAQEHEHAHRRAHHALPARGTAHAERRARDADSLRAGVADHHVAVGDVDRHAVALTARGAELEVLLGGRTG